jgi:photosystem II stability/assembly factor-like uncharacterized protein
VEPHLNTVYFVNAKDGWVGGEFGVILHTTDGGQTWISQRYGSDLPQIVAIRFRDNRNGWAVGQKGTLLKTADGKKIWRPVQLASQEDFYGMSVDGENGVIVGHGVILRTNNESAWTRVELPQKLLWLSSVAIHRQTAIGVGQSGTIHTINLNHNKRTADEGVRIR